MPTKCTLVIDMRERLITRHEKELENITCIKKQITIGDYAVIAPNGKILAIIERKSLDDAAASFKDGRWENRKKMFKLRDQTGCKILFIIEGLKNNDPNQLCDRYTPYKNIESSIFHMMMNNVSTIWTMDTIDTARTIARFVHSMDTLVTNIDAMDQLEKPLDDSLDKPSEELTDYADLLTQKHTKTDHEISREMWSTFRGIAATTADEFMRKYSIADIVMGIVPIGELENFKYITGHKINKIVLESLTMINSGLEIRLLKHIPGISTRTAKMIIEYARLKHLLAYEQEAISLIKVGKNNRNLGAIKAEQIKRLFNYKYIVIQNTT